MVFRAGSYCSRILTCCLCGTPDRFLCYGRIRCEKIWRNSRNTGDGRNCRASCCRISFRRRCTSYIREKPFSEGISFQIRKIKISFYKNPRVFQGIFLFAIFRINRDDVLDHEVLHDRRVLGFHCREALRLLYDCARCDCVRGDLIRST